MSARKPLPSDAKVLEFPFSSRDPDHVRDGGYVLIWRRLFEEGDSVLGTNRLLIGAWIELISSAAHKPTERRIGESWFHLQRGQLVISLHEIARNWGVPWTTFWRACKRMESSGRIRLDTVRVRSKVEPTRTLVTICNYDLYQNPAAYAEPTADQGRTNPYKESKTEKAKKDSDSSLRSESCPAGAGRALALKPLPFDEIWKLQRLPGQKRGKGSAEKAWAKACKRELPERIIEAFAQHQACWERFGWEVEFIPHLATWLNQGRWQDDLPRPRSEGNGHERYRRPSAVQSLWNEYTEARGRAAGFGEGDDQPLLAHSQEARGRGGSSRAPEALPGRFTEIS